MSNFGPAPRPDFDNIDAILDQLDAAPRTINYGVAAAVTTVYALVAADDGESGPAPKRELSRLMAINDRLESTVSRSPAVGPSGDRVDVFQQLHTCLGATRTIVVAQASFPTAREEIAAAGQVTQTLFAEGAVASSRRYRDLWLAADRLIKKVDASAELAFNLELLVGPWALDTLRPLHARAGALLGITAPAAALPAEDILDLLRQHREQAGLYERAVLGEMDSQDPASVRRAEALLLPLAKVREEARFAATKGRTTEDDAADDVDGPAGASPVTAPAAAVAPAPPVEHARDDG